MESLTFGYVVKEPRKTKKRQIIDLILNGKTTKYIANKVKTCPEYVREIQREIKNR